ncbi:MAG TPA: hypothetical protein VM553_20535, partial [Dongiaceae bacterium]|nr:hypothetical protein [Dongiaceae bacterium]
MPFWVTFYVAFIVISLPVGVYMLRRLENDWLHPVGGLLSTALSIAFVFAYWMPDAVPFNTPSTILMYLFMIFWDLYTLMRVRTKLPEYLNMSEDSGLRPDSGTWLLGIL